MKSPLKIILGCALVALTCQVSHAVVDGHLITDELLLNSVVTVETETGRCTGIVVGRKTILTAAHCIDVKGTGHLEIPKPVLVRTFITANVSSEKNHLINFFESSRSAAPGKDFGYIYLTENLNFQGSPVQLDFNPIAADDELCVAGVGVDENGIAGNLKIRCNMSVTVDTGEGLLFLKDKTEPKAGIGAGDSGGPVYRKLKDGSLAVVGIISRGGDGKGTALYQPGHTTSLITSISTDYAKKWISAYKCLSINFEPADKGLFDATCIIK